MVAPGGEAARYILALDGDPDGARASQALAGIEEDLPELASQSGLGEATIGVTGDTTIATELTEETWSAFARVAPGGDRGAAARCSGSCCAAGPRRSTWSGSACWSSPLRSGSPSTSSRTCSATESSPSSSRSPASILLLALGADYNVFLISRIWGEAEDAPLKAAIRTAGASAGRAITVAGLILALSFAAVMLIPIQSFREIGFALFVGLLLDTLIARTLLIPALVALFGSDHAQVVDEPRVISGGSEA